MSRAALSLAGTVGAAAAYIAYDYETCHPMRRLQGYGLHGAWIRFHNSFRPNITLTEMTLEELSEYNGAEGRPTYFSSDGLIWDVSSFETFKDTYSFWKGKDASVALAIMSMSHKDVNRTDWENLTENDWKSLHSWTRYFQEKYIIKGRLKEYQTKQGKRLSSPLQL